MSDLGRLAERLDTVIADLDEIAFDRLREASADGETSRPAGDKELVRARRAVEKASHILRALDDSGDRS